MSDPIAFYFDFSSPYGYLASTRIDAIAMENDREAAWYPFLMGAAMKITGSAPLVQRPMIDAYFRLDIERSARLLEVPFAFPEPFPIATVAACRAVYWLEGTDPAAAKTLIKALYHAYFVNGRNITGADIVADVAAESGSDRDAVLAGIQEPAVKERLKAVTDTAIKLGVFGSPFFIVDGEPFWGHDRLEQVANWIEIGGW